MALAKLLRLHGSDKSTVHSYYLAYSALLANRRAEPLRILEIGIGTNDPDAPSSMGTAGRPGASLRAWRDWGPRFEVHGADIDRRILFQEERIKTHWVDQTSLESLAGLETLGKGSFDLIIDDGLHRPDANLKTLAFAMRMLKPNGIVVIEDIIKPLAPFWLSVGNLLSDRAATQLLFDRKEALFIVRPKAQA
jgi:SAM-dependent methyltransferase